MTTRNDFEQIYTYVRTIPPGRVLSYGEVGQAVGVTPRTVGWAMAQCPDDVPWHRVVGADGYLRIARRSPLHFEEQKTRLADEGVLLDDKNRVPPEYFLSDSEE